MNQEPVYHIIVTIPASYSDTAVDDITYEIVSAAGRAAVLNGGDREDLDFQTYLPKSST